MTTTFSSFGLPPVINSALARMNYTAATPIQAQAIPPAMAGRDVLGSAQTGTGKTAAFSIPMIVRLMNDPKAMGLVLAPTRELAAQTLDVVHKLTSNNRDMRTALLIGGEPMGKQFAQLREQPRLIIGTPGRINDHLRRNPNLLKDVVFIAVDEADRMLDMGFSEQIDEIFATVPKERQMVMFSATFPDSIIKFSRKYLNNPERISVNPESVSAPNIKHEVRRTSETEKYPGLLAELEARDGSVIIFVKTQHGTDRLAKRLEHDGHDSIAIHGGLRQNQRERAVRMFRTQRCRILVATDVAARGLDIPHIEHVINYDLPQVAEDYIHRIGRTARAGAEGNAMCFVLPSDNGKWNAINRILNPGAAPQRGERRDREDSRPNRGAKSGGFKSGGYKGRNDRNFADRAPKTQGGFRRDRGDEFRSGTRSGAERPRQDRASQDRQYQDRPYQGRANQDRPRQERNDWNRSSQGERSSERPRNDYGRPRYEDGNRAAKPFARDGNRDSNRKPQAPTDRNWNSKEGRAPYKKDDRAPYRKDDRPFNKKPQGGNFSRPENGSRPFRKDDRAPAAFRSEERDDQRKPKKPKREFEKKPFKFKEHSRKPSRAAV